MAAGAVRLLMARPILASPRSLINDAEPKCNGPEVPSVESISISHFLFRELPSEILSTWRALSTDENNLADFPVISLSLRNCAGNGSLDSIDCAVPEFACLKSQSV